MILSRLEKIEKFFDHKNCPYCGVITKSDYNNLPDDATTEDSQSPYGFLVAPDAISKEEWSKQAAITSRQQQAKIIEMEEQN